MKTETVVLTGTCEPRLYARQTFYHLESLEGQMHFHIFFPSNDVLQTHPRHLELYNGDIKRFEFLMLHNTVQSGSAQLLLEFSYRIPFIIEMKII